MKKLAILAVLTIFLGGLASGCGKIESVKANTVVKIERSIDGGFDTMLLIACERAQFDTQKWEIIVEGLVSIAGNNGNECNWPVRKMEIQNGNLIIHIPDNVAYEIAIGPQRYYCWSKNFSDGKRIDEKY